MLQLQNVSFSYAEEINLHNLDFSVENGAHLCIIGESGCGKSTLLKAIYGLLDLAEGEIFWEDEKVLGPAYNLIPGHLTMKYLPQEFELMPYISVEENIKKFLSRQHPEESEARCQELLEVTDMLLFAKTEVKLLSGGQKQRVALAQTLAKEPRLLLLDEPFNFIDNFRKNKLRRNIFNYLKKQNITCLFATHDSTDMFGFADEVLVLKEGKIVAQGTPEKLFENPPNYYVASLFKEVNEISAQVFKQESDQKLLIYPHELKVVVEGGFEVGVKKSYYNGNDFFIAAEIMSTKEQVFFFHTFSIEKDDKVSLTVKEDLLVNRIKE